MQSSANQILSAYACRRRPRNPRTDPVRLCKQSALQRYGRRSLTVTARTFVEAAVQQFASGNLREGRYFYNGAFAFVGRNKVRGMFCRCGLATAVKAMKADDHQTVWRVLAAVHAYAPNNMAPHEVNELFTARGIPLFELRSVEDDPAITHLCRIGAKLPVPALAL